MPVTHDVFSLLRIFARYGKSSNIGYASFCSFATRYARKYAGEHPDLSVYLKDPEKIIEPKLRELSVGGKLSLECDRNDSVQKIIFPYFFVDAVAAEYLRMETVPELPFPTEATLHLREAIPGDIVRSVSIETDLYTLVDEPPTVREPILRLVLAEDGGSFFILPRLVQAKLLDYAILKLRYYLTMHSNKDYIQSKLLPAFAGKEMMFKNALNLLLTRPYDAAGELRKGGDFSYPFFAHLSGLIRTDLQKKNERIEEETAVYRAAYVVEFYNNYFKSKAQKSERVDSAFRNLDRDLKKAPYFFSLDSILDFKDSGGVLLLGQYSREQLEAYLRKKTTSEDRDRLPLLLSFHVTTGERYFVLKENVFPLFLKLSGDVRGALRSAYISDWFRTKSDYETTDVMEQDIAFAHDMEKRIEAEFPIFAALLDYRILALVYDELPEDKKTNEVFDRIFYKGGLAPLPDILGLSRKDLLVDVKIMLPFWYTVPILCDILALFHRRRAKPAPKPQTGPSSKIAVDVQGEAADQEYRKNFEERKRYLESLESLGKSLVPEGRDIDEYLAVLEDRWNTLISPDAKQNLRADVDSIIRDYLRKYIRTLKIRAPTAERLEEMADTLVKNTSFSKIRSQEYLHEYIKLYIYKLVVKSGGES